MSSNIIIPQSPPRLMPQQKQKKQKQKGITFGYCDPNTGQRVYPAMADLLPDQLPPPQQSSPSTDNDMYANVTCVPPVGQATTIAKDQQSVWYMSVNASESTR